MQAEFPHIPGALFDGEGRKLADGSIAFLPGCVCVWFLGLGCAQEPKVLRMICF